jgi:hypothetical protein
MDIEKSMRSLRWRDSAEPLERRVLAAARHARVEQRFWRWTWWGLAASVVVAVALNVSIRPGPNQSGARRVELASSPAFEAPGVGEFRERARMALSPPITPRKMLEVLP